MKEDVPKKLGDTLDYYNDSMPRKAVEALFDKADKPRPDPKRIRDEKYISGYKDTTEIPAVTGKRTPVSDDPPPPTPDDVSSPKTIIPSKKTYDDIEENISLYSSKSREARRRAFMEEVRHTPMPSKSPIVSEEEDESFASQKEDDYGDESSPAPLPIFKIGVGAAAFIFLFILTALVFKLNSVNARLAEANANLTKQQDDSADYQRALIENGGLKEEITSLMAEVEQLKAELASNPSQPAEPSPGSSQNTQVNNSNQGYASYTVKDGDTLSSISREFYGTFNDYQKIMDANSMTGTSIFPGQVLKIPK